MYHYKAKSIDDNGSGGFLCCQTERRDERRKKREIKQEFDRQSQTSHIRKEILYCLEPKSFARLPNIFSFYSVDSK